MSNFSSAMQTSDAKTENNAVTHSTSGAACLDAFSRLPAMRAAPEAKLWTTFHAAFQESPSTALKILFHLRDIRGGTGEREIFRKILTRLASQNPQAVERNMHLIPTYGRWDDLFCLKDTQLSGVMYKLLADSLAKDIAAWRANEPLSMLSKWMPNEGSKNHQIYAGFCAFTKWRPKQYRKTITMLRQRLVVVEQQMCARKWDGITFSRVPSHAMKIYSKSFAKHAPAEFTAYLEAVKSGKEKINATTLYPYDLVHTCYSSTADLQWKALPNYIQGGKSILPVVDVSGSMDQSIGGGSGVSCAHVAISLGLYCAERQKSAFHDHLMTFESKPKFHLLTGNTLWERVQEVKKSASDMGSTNLQAVFSLLLAKAVKAGLAQEDMPDVVLILSDLEFDRCGNDTNAEAIRAQYAQAGYQLPLLAWWNIQSRNDQSPVKKDDEGNVLIAGCSPAIMTSVLSCDFKTVTPLMLMHQTLDKPRYAAIV